LFKFNETYFKNEFYNVTLLHNERVLDKTVFNALIRFYNENKKKNPDQPLFLYLTTMQNHSPYNKINKVTVTVKGYEDIYQLNTYLTGVKLTDDALKELIEYFSKVDDDVVVVLFGDHHPSIRQFTDKYLGGTTVSLPLEKRVLLYQTPYLIWANYPIEGRIENMSLSYVSSSVMEVAGFPKTAYRSFLDDTKKHVPMMTSFAYMDSDRVWHSRQKKTNASAYLDRYWLVQQHMINGRRRKK